MSGAEFLLLVAAPGAGLALILLLRSASPRFATAAKLLLLVTMIGMLATNAEGTQARFIVAAEIGVPLVAMEFAARLGPLKRKPLRTLVLAAVTYFASLMLVVVIVVNTGLATP